MTELINKRLVIDEDGTSLRKRGGNIQYQEPSGQKCFYDIEDIKSIDIKSNIMISTSVIEECMIRNIDVIFTFMDKSYNICSKLDL